MTDPGPMNSPATPPTSPDAAGAAAGGAPGGSSSPPPSWTPPPVPAGSPQDTGTPPPGPAGPPPGTWSPPPLEPGPAPGLAFAGFWVRLIAFIVDQLILSVPTVILSGVFVTGAVLSGSFNFGGLALVGVLGLLISAAYFIYTWTAWRATVGDRLLGLLVLNAADGSALTVNQAAVRWGLLALPSALSSASAGHILLGGLVGLLVLIYYAYLAYTTATDLRKQGFHDRTAGTVVVKPTLR